MRIHPVIKFGEKINPRYVEYARAHGKTPQEQMDADRVTWPGGVMTEFICWIGARWAEWDKLQGRKLGEPHIGKDHADFDAWLATRAPEAE